MGGPVLQLVWNIVGDMLFLHGLRVYSQYFRDPGFKDDVRVEKELSVNVREP